jgi:hypothetical protein
MSKSEQDQLLYLKVKEYIKYLKTVGCFDVNGKLIKNEFSIIHYGFSLN